MCNELDRRIKGVPEMSVNLRTGLPKEKRVGSVALKLSDCKAGCKYVRGDRSSRFWQRYAKVLLSFLLCLLFVLIKTERWMPFSSNQSTQPTVLEVGSFLTTGNPHGPLERYSRPFPRHAVSELKEEPQRRPKSRTKYVHREFARLEKADFGQANISASIKIYVYDLPPSFNKDWLEDERCSRHLFAAEVAIHHRLLHSPFRTLAPAEADFFFVPVYVSCNFSSRTGFPSLGHAPSLLKSAVKLISRDMPYWNRREGRDHIFTATHDYGPCFRTMEDIAVSAGIPHFLKRSIILQTFGLVDKHPCQAPQHIQIPPYVPETFVKEGWQPEKQRRDIWAFFRGKMEVHPKNDSGRIYSRGIRTTIWQKFRRNRRFFIKRTRSDDYVSEIQRSVFCLCPLGWAPWSPRLVESVLFGCVPVIIADKIALPYSHVIDWSKMSVTVPEKDVSKLYKILEKVSRTNLSIMQHYLWKEEHRRALLYMDPMTQGDATWQILELLSRMRGKTIETHLSLPNQGGNFGVED